MAGVCGGIGVNLTLFVNDLEKLIVEISEKRARADGDFGAKIEFEQEELRLRELIKDTSDFSYSLENEPLAKKLYEFNDGDEFHRGYGILDAVELEARARRVERIIKTFGLKNSSGILRMKGLETQ